MAKLFLANQVNFNRFKLNPPEFEVSLMGRIDGKGEETEIFFKDEGAPDDLLIVHHILGLLNESYANAKAVGTVGRKKFFMIALTVDDAGKKIVLPVVETPPPKESGAGAKVEVERSITTKVTVSEGPGPKS